MATTKTWPDFQAQLKLELKTDAARLTDPELDQLLSRAGEIYAKDRPRAVVTDIPATSAFEYAVPSDWDGDDSFVLQVEHPAGEQDPSIIPDDEWMIYRQATGTYKLRFLETSPNNGAIRLTYTIPHVLKSTPTPNGTNTIPDSAFMAAIYKAAQLACESLAAQYAKTSDPTIAADVVNYRTKSQEFSDRAKDFLARYGETIKKDEAAGEIGEWDVLMAGGGRQMFHRPKWR
jgi:hypothetical protein